MTNDEKYAAIRESNAKMGTIVSQGTRADGTVCFTSHQSSADPSADHHLMSAFLLFNHRVGQGLQLEPHKLGNLWISRHKPQPERQAQYGTGEPTLAKPCAAPELGVPSDSLDRMMALAHTVTDDSESSNFEAVRLADQAELDAAGKQRLIELLQLEEGEQRWTNIAMAVNDLLARKVTDSESSTVAPAQAPDTDSELAKLTLLLEAEDSSDWDTIESKVRHLVATVADASSLIDMAVSYSECLSRFPVPRELRAMFDGENPHPIVNRLCREWQEKADTDNAYRVWPDYTVSLIEERADGSIEPAPEWMSDDFTVIHAGSHVAALRKFVEKENQPMKGEQA